MVLTTFCYRTPLLGGEIGRRHFDIHTDDKCNIVDETISYQLPTYAAPQFLQKLTPLSTIRKGLVVILPLLPGADLLGGGGGGTREPQTPHFCCIFKNVLQPSFAWHYVINRFKKILFKSVLRSLNFWLQMLLECCKTASLRM